MAPTPAPDPQPQPDPIPPDAGPAPPEQEISRPVVRPSRPSSPSTTPPYRRRTPVRSRGGGVVRKKRRRKRRSSSQTGVLLVLLVAALAGVAGGIAGVRLLISRRAQAGDILAGYISDSDLVDTEYRRYFGKDAPSQSPRQQFQNAARLVRTRSFSEAATLLESAAAQAAVPVVFNDLGVVYAQLDDRPRAGAAFHEALARDANYPAVLANLARLKRITADQPVQSHEVEPNNHHYAANLIPVGVPVQGEISAATADVDFFRFRVPAAPRDVMAVELTSRDPKFAPRLEMYNADERMLDWGLRTAPRGGSVTVYGSAEPNSSMYVSVTGGENTSGPYVLTIKPLKAYDDYEPNDDIFHARRVQCHVPIQANIMDLEDVDYFSFLAPRTGSVSIDIHNESVTLIPAVQLHGPDLRSMGFGPVVHNPGDSLTANLNVEEGQLYYVQVWPQAETSGAYTLTVH